MNIKYRRKISLLLNLIIFILELIGFLYTIYKKHKLDIEFYTIDSNLLAMITSLLFIIFYKKDKEIIRDLRFISTNCLTVTCLVVLFILIPMNDFNYKKMMFKDTFLIFHTLCPIISIISYIFFEKRNNKRYLGFIITAFYGIILTVLNILKVVDGPYPFLKVRSQSILISIIWMIIIIGGSYIIGIILNYSNKERS